jgi:hypothetical protein
MPVQRNAENFIFDSTNSTTHNPTNMAAMDKAIEELNSHDYSGKIPYQFVAQKYGLVDTTLRRRYRAEIEPREVKYLRQQLLTPEQEVELTEWINDKTQGKKPPDRYLVAEKASLLAGRDVGVGWVYRFHQRHADVLVFKNPASLDRLHHQAQIVAGRKRQQQIKAEEQKEKAVTKEVEAHLRREAARQKRLGIEARRAARLLKKQHQPKPGSDSKPASNPRPKSKPIVGANSGGSDSGGADGPPPPPTTTTRSGRDIKTPARYR